ncbi:aromatic prenyltransferase [Pseudomassariella vexata]|uniref:Aromatic prenyltransferase n=1 Tax=Pseudomassariella vexata TaxID=1141098 RepID=A0A1Y2EHM4_9PEZI|nr:aromatic prenyltransferase [Pseudomassariella vexata]ORY71068.1 aromatic prenyltransferase [Pseudomassariella vexata]
MATPTKTNGNKINGQNSVSTILPVLNQVKEEIHTDYDDRNFWWGALAEPLATLLQTSQYAYDVQLKYLRWFHKWIPAALGPRPISGKPFYGSWLTYDRSALEYSLNWKEKSPFQTVRFTLEPMSKKAGTSADRLNQTGAKEFFTAVAMDIPSLDLERFNHFLAATHVPDEAVDKAVAKHPPGFPRSRVWVAFDLERSGGIVAKAYFLPHWRSLYTEVSTRTIVFDAIRKCNGPSGSYESSIAALNEHLDAFPPGETPEIVLLSNDCVADARSRIKVYVHSEADTLAKARHMFHLGGRLKGSAMVAGLKAVDDFWHHLFGLSRSDPDADDKVVLSGHKCLLVYEMRPTSQEGAAAEVSPDIEVKLHIPTWELGKTDTEIGALMSSWFQANGHPELAARYQPDLAATFPKHQLSTTGGTHTFISLTYTHKTGLYMTTYYTTRLPEMHFPLD